jgi:preprotein translocase subunit Sss1
MRRIVIQNYVQQQLIIAKKKKPSVAVYLMILANMAVTIGVIGFFISFVSIVIQSSFSQPLRVSSLFSGSLGIYFLVIILGTILEGGIASLLGVRRSQFSLKNPLGALRGGDDVGRLEAGLAGEESVATELRRLDDKWVLFSGVVLPGMPGDIDHVLVGPSGLFALEVKNWSGRIVYNDNTAVWSRSKNYQPQSEILKDPAEQIVQLAGLLSSAVKHKTVPVVVFVNPNSTVDAKDHPRATILTLSQLVNWVTAQPVCLSQDQVETYSGALNKAAIRTPDPAAQKSPTPAQVTKPPFAGVAPSKPPSRPRRGCRIVAVALTVLLIAAVALTVVAVRLFVAPQTGGCTIVETTYIRSGPSMEDKLLGTAPKGTCLTFDGRTEDGYWIRISGSGSFRWGWTTINYLEITPEEVKDLPVKE